MPRKFEREALEADLQAVRQLLASTPEADPVGRIVWTSRIQEIEGSLAALRDLPDTVAEIALIFGGSPVKGARAIDAEFAGKALEAYQGLIARRLAASESGLAQRGPIPGRDAARLLVTDVVRGSFGFLLEEPRADEPQFIPSALRATVGEVTNLLSAFADQSEEHFNEAVEALDTRVFIGVREFLSALQEHHATLRLFDGDREEQFDEVAVERAHTRSIQTSIDESRLVAVIDVLGVTPIGRRFDARDVNSQEIISGKVGPAFGQTYLERVERGEEPLVGQRMKGEFHRKEIKRSGGGRSVILTLLDLKPLDD